MGKVMVIDITKCNGCHSFLSLHGENRNQIEQCVLCHNPSENDSSVRGVATVAAEEGSGKSFLALEMAVRVAVASGSFAGTWPVVRTGPVLYLSEMHADEDYGREATVLDSLGLERDALSGRYYRLPLMTSAGGRPAKPAEATWAPQRHA